MKYIVAIDLRKFKLAIWLLQRRIHSTGTLFRRSLLPGCPSKATFEPPADYGLPPWIAGSSGVYSVGLPRTAHGLFVALGPYVQTRQRPSVGLRIDAPIGQNGHDPAATVMDFRTGQLVIAAGRRIGDHYVALFVK